MKKSMNKKRLGKVCIGLYYYVDLDNQEQVEKAKDYLFKDIISACNHDESISLFKTVRVYNTPESSISKSICVNK